MYYQKSGEGVLKELKSRIDGLSHVEAETRKAEYGLNQLNETSKINPWKIFFSQFNDFITYILLFAVIFSIIIGEVADSVIIFIILIFNALIGFLQEFKAHKSLEALKNLSVVQAKVFRDGVQILIDSKELVPGDVIYLESGDKVPADCRILEFVRLKVDESTLTGESVPVNKISSSLKKQVQLADRKNMLYSSTVLIDGTATAVVVNTAMDTEIGKIAHLVQTADEELTPLQKKLDSFGKKLGGVIITICLIVLSLSVIQSYAQFGSLTMNALVGFSFIAISLAVAAVPTALPTVVTIALSVGVNRLLAKKALVKNLSSVETLGSCDVICTDKTGTLTKNEMTVTNIWTFDGSSEVSGLGYCPEGKLTKKLKPLIYEIGYNCNNASIFEKEKEWKITGDPTEAALLVSALKSGLVKKIPRHGEIPFDSDRKLMSVLVRRSFGLRVYTKGATDELLKKCTHVIIKGKKVRITKNHINKILTENDIYGSSALRVLSFAYKDVKSKASFSEEKLTFVGMQAMRDPPREEVTEAIYKTKQAGIRVIMITGDHKITAKAIGDEIGISGGVMTGEDIDGISDQELASQLENGVNIFARVIPEHKQRIISSLQSLNYVVAMTGDGVNDAPALKKANIGVAVGSGTDVAKEASDFVLLDDSFANIVGAIEEGRGIYDNIQKSIMLLLSGNLGEVLIIFGAILLGFNLPLTAILLLWINLITDGAPALAFSVDPYGKDIMNRPPVSSNESILPNHSAWLIGVRGVFSAIIALVLFSFYGGNMGPDYLPLAQTMVFSFVVVSELLLIFIIRSNYRIKQLSNIWLWLGMILSLVLQAVIMYTPLNVYFGIVRLNWVNLLVVGAVAFGFYLVFMTYQVLETYSLVNRNELKELRAIAIIEEANS